MRYEETRLELKPFSSRTIHLSWVVAVPILLAAHTVVLPRILVRHHDDGEMRSTSTVGKS